MIKKLSRGGLTLNKTSWRLYKATGTNAIATETEARAIGGTGTATANKCCTKDRAIALGCGVNGSYESNQLVKYSSLYKPINWSIDITWRISGSYRPSYYVINLLDGTELFTYQYTYLDEWDGTLEVPSPEFDYPFGNGNVVESLAVWYVDQFNNTGKLGSVIVGPWTLTDGCTLSIRTGMTVSANCTVNLL